MTDAALILATPLAALGLGFFWFYRRCPACTHWPVLASCAVVTVAAWRLAASVLAGAPAQDEAVWTWLSAGGLTVEFGLRVDGMGAAVLAMVTLVGSLIHAYAVGYMRRDPGFSRFFLYFHLFLFSMLGLLLSNNFLQLYLFWEGVGLASYLLIGFWYGRESARRAALKAFVVNRIGDACFLFALFLLARHTGTFRFVSVFAKLNEVPAQTLPWIAGLLFMGACAKSAQFPLYVWLPDAMEGPTPTSALMHAATMVTAGVFLMARSWPLLERCPQILLWIAATGAFTAVGAALLAFTKRDLKRILAYSTVSHLGLMMLAIGCGNAYAAIVHLIAHGFFKAALFLCAGNVLHAVGKPSADVDDAGGLARDLPLTARSFALAGAALAGIPGTAGFFSKDLVLEAAVHRHWLLGAAAGLVALGSGLYIGRMYWLTFHGKRPEQKHPGRNGPENPLGQSGHGHDPWLEWPVAILAGLAVFGGLAFIPTGVLWRLINSAPLWAGEPFRQPRIDWGLAAVGLAAAGVGLGVSWFLSMGRPSWDWQWRRSSPVLERWLDADFGWQPLTTHGVTQAAGGLARLVGTNFDRRTLDRLIESIADSFVGLSEGLSGLSRGLLNEYLWWMAVGTSLFMLGLAWAR